MPENIYAPGSAISHQDDARSAASTGDVGRMEGTMTSQQRAVQQ